MASQRAYTTTQLNDNSTTMHPHEAGQVMPGHAHTIALSAISITSRRKSSSELYELLSIFRPTVDKSVWKRPSETDGKARNRLWLRLSKTNAETASSLPPIVAMKQCQPRKNHDAAS
jgi:hypothetical protein